VGEMEFGGLEVLGVLDGRMHCNCRKIMLRFVTGNRSMFLAFGSAGEWLGYACWKSLCEHVRIKTVEYVL
jgi:hypothetical protein